MPRWTRWPSTPPTPARWRAMMAKALRTFGRVDVLVANAGITTQYLRIDLV